MIDLTTTPREKRLNLGCGDDIQQHRWNVDRFEVPGVDQVVDLNFVDPAGRRRQWPWADGHFREVFAYDVIEHLHDKIYTMNEIWRILVAGGILDLAVPTTDGPGAWQDPTHCSWWNRRSFLYYEEGSPYRERFAKSYGIVARFQTLYERLEDTVDGPRLLLTLEVVK